MFTIIIHYLTGRKEKLEVTSVKYFGDLKDEKGNVTAERFDSYEIWTMNNLLKVVPRANIESIDYDVAFTELTKKKD